MAYDVFISHSIRNKAVAEALCDRLEATGRRCWMAPRDILPGLEWGEAIMSGIKQSRIFLLVFSSHANTSKQVLREVERAASRDMVLLPVRVEDIEPSAALEYYISTPQWLDAITPPLEAHLDRLVQVVARLPEAVPELTAAERAPPGVPQGRPVPERQPAPAPLPHPETPKSLTTPAPPDRSPLDPENLFTATSRVRAHEAAGRTVPQRAAGISGIVFLVSGGLILLGGYIILLLVDLLLGAWGLLAASGVAAARTYHRIGAAVSVAVVLPGTLGLIGYQTEILGPTGVLFHALLAAEMGYFGFVHRETGVPANS